MIEALILSNEQGFIEAANGQSGGKISKKRKTSKKTRRKKR